MVREVLRDEMAWSPLLFAQPPIVATARWVHPDTFNALPVWCPDTARGRPRYDATWSRELISGRGVRKVEENIRAAIALMEALGVKGKPQELDRLPYLGIRRREFRREEQCRTRPAILFLHWQHDLVANAAEGFHRRGPADQGVPARVRFSALRVGLRAR